MRLVESDAVERTARALREQHRGNVRALLVEYGLDLDDVLDWTALLAMGARSVVDEPRAFEARFAGAVGAAIVVGIELARGGEA